MTNLMMPCWKLSYFFSAVVSVEDQLPMGGGEIIGAIQHVLDSIQELKDACQRKHVRGRPQISIKEDQLEFLLELHFYPSDLARFFFSVSTRTIRSRIVHYGLDEMTSYSDLADGALDEITRLWGPIPIVVEDHLQAFWEEWGWKSSGNHFEKVRKEWVQEELVRNFARYFTDMSTMFVCQIACGTSMAIINWLSGEL